MGQGIGPSGENAQTHEQILDLDEIGSKVGPAQRRTWSNVVREVGKSRGAIVVLLVVLGAAGMGLATLLKNKAITDRGGDSSISGLSLKGNARDDQNARVALLDEVVEQEALRTAQAINGTYISPLAPATEKELSARRKQVAQAGGNIAGVDAFGRTIDAQGRLVDAQGRLIDANGRLIDEQGRLIDQYGRLVDARGRLVDEYGRLVDEFGRLVDENGQLIQPQPSQRDRNGNLIDSQGRMVDAQGRLIDQYGRLINAQGHLVDELGRRINEHGQLINAQGQLVDAQGNRISTQGQRTDRQDQAANRGTPPFARDAQGRLVDAHGRLVDSQGRLVDSQGRLVDEYGRLIDQDGNLIDGSAAQGQSRNGAATGRGAQGQAASIPPPLGTDPRIAGRVSGVDIPAVPGSISGLNSAPSAGRAPGGRSAGGAASGAKTEEQAKREAEYIKKVEESMAKQVQGLMAQISPTAAGAPAIQTLDASVIASYSTPPKKTTQADHEVTLGYPQGTIWGATLITGADSERPGILRAEIDEGPFAGREALCNFEWASREYFAIECHAIKLDRESLPVKLIMVASDTMPGIKANYEGRYVKRLGAQFLAQFPLSYAEGLEQGGTTQTNAAGTTQTTNSIDGKDLAIYAAGKSMAPLAQEIKDIVDEIKPRASVPPMQSVGLMLAEDI